MKIVKQQVVGDILLTVIRVGIGWHFLYEGLSKLLAINWTSYSFLVKTTGVLSPFYHLLASNPLVLKSVDLLNIYGLLVIGLALFVGYLVRLASLAGFLLMVLYYFAYPPFGASIIAQVDEGSIFIVNKLFIEGFILLFFTLITARGYGIDELLRLIKKRSRETTLPKEKQRIINQQTRRDAIKNLSTIPVLCAVGWNGIRNLRNEGVDVMTGATIQVGESALKDLKGELPKGKLGNLRISRLIAGGNLIGGWAHARDLIYSEMLFKAYNSEKKIFETLILAEKAGIDTINIGFPTGVVMAKYKKLNGSKIKVITQVAPGSKSSEIFDQINQAIDLGSDILQVQGNHSDVCARDGKLDVIQKMLEKMKDQGYVAGLGAHSLESLIRCEQAGITPDYYMKTMHHDNYWSAHPKEFREPFEVMNGSKSDHSKFHDNLFCNNPEQTAEFVNKTKIPVMGFKVLAAGAIHPEDGFKWAFKNGADFICVGMFDFQLVNDANICIDTLKNLQGRTREWYS